MTHHLMHALAPFGKLIFGRHEFGTNTFVARLPVPAAVVRAINAAGRDRYEHPLIVRWIGKNSVQAESTAARHPLRAMRMIEQAAFERPRLAGIRRLEERGRFNPAVKCVALMRIH